MYVRTSGGRVGRNVWHQIENGNVSLTDGCSKVNYSVKGGIITGYVEKQGRHTLHVRYGKFKKTTSKIDGKCVVTENVRFKKGSNCALANGKHFYKTLHNTPEGKCLIEFIIKRGTCYRKGVKYYGIVNIKAYYPDKKLYITYNPFDGMQMYYKNGTLFKKFSFGSSSNGKHSNPIKQGWTWEYSRSNILPRMSMSRSYLEEEYTRSGKLKSSIGYKNGPRDGKCLVNNKAKYYIKGVQVSAKVFTSPETLSMDECMAIPNAQLRMAILSKIGGVEGAIKKNPDSFQTMDVDENGNKLYKYTSKAHPALVTGPWKQGDKYIMKIVELICPSTKSHYFIKVHPNIKSVEHARLWHLCLMDENGKPTAKFSKMKFKAET